MNNQLSDCRMSLRFNTELITFQDVQTRSSIGEKRDYFLANRICVMYIRQRVERKMLGEMEKRFAFLCVKRGRGQLESKVERLELLAYKV